MIRIPQAHILLPKARHCRSCAEPITDFIDFGNMPLAGNFLDTNAPQEPLYPMQVALCPNCMLVQIPNIVSKEILFNENYHYFSSVTQTLNQHFEQYAQFLAQFLKNRLSPTVLEFGCNDGVLLEKLQKYGIGHLGIDASANVAQYAQKRGLNVICGFFSPDIVSQALAHLPKKPDLITGSNVFAHNHDVENILKAVVELLAPDGYFVVEVHYLLPLIQEFQFDFFYHEHCNYYSVHSLKYLLAQYDLEIIQVQDIVIHGGSIRVVAQNKKYAQVQDSVAQFLTKEQEAGLNQMATYSHFAEQIAQFKSQMVDLLQEKKAQGKKIFAYGASGRAVTLLNYLGVGHLLEFMVDDSPSRAGHIFPGNQLPIYLPNVEQICQTDICLISAWSYSKEIRNKMPYYLDGKREFIIPLPQIEIVQ